MPNRAEILKQKFQNSLALPFEQVLTQEVIQQILEQVSYRQTIYTPSLDVASARPGQSLSHTVARVIAWLSESGAVVPSSDTGAYSKARKRLPLSVIQRLAQTAQTLSVQISDEQRCVGGESAPMMAQR